MDQDFSADLISLLDEDGKEWKFQIRDELDNDDGVFYAPLPASDDPQDALETDGSYYIFELIEEDGEEQLAEVEDEELLNKLSEIFESHFEEMYEDDEESEEEE